MFRVLEPVDDVDDLAGKLDVPHLQERLDLGQVGAYRIAGHNAALIMSVGTAIDTGAKGLWVEALGGHIGWHPHRNRVLMQDVFADTADIGRYSGCSEIRIEASTRSALKQRLFKHFGFEAHTFGPSIYMRKAL